MQNTVRWCSDWLDGAIVVLCLGIPGQTKVSGDRQRETTNEICCLAAECTVTFKKKLVTRVRTRDFTVCMYV